MSSEASALVSHSFIGICPLLWLVKYLYRKIAGLAWIAIFLLKRLRLQAFQIASFFTSLASCLPGFLPRTAGARFTQPQGEKYAFRRVHTALVEDIRSYFYSQLCYNFFHVTANNYYVYWTLFAVTDYNILCQNKI